MTQQQKKDYVLRSGFMKFMQGYQDIVTHALPESDYLSGEVKEPTEFVPTEFRRDNELVLRIGFDSDNSEQLNEFPTITLALLHMIYRSFNMMKAMDPELASDEITQKLKEVIDMQKAFMDKHGLLVPVTSFPIMKIDPDIMLSGLV